MHRCAACLVAVVLGVGRAAAQDPAPTPAEREQFLATPSYAETLSYLRDLAARWDGIALRTFGHSAEGRELPLVVVSKDRTFDPAAAHATGRAVVLVQNGIHAAE